MTLKQRIKKTLSHPGYQTFTMEVSRGRWSVLTSTNGHKFLCHFHFEGQRNRLAGDIISQDDFFSADSNIGYGRRPTNNSICGVCKRVAPKDIRTYFLLR